MSDPVQHQQHMVELFQTTKQNISLHLKNIFADNELVREATDKEFLSVQTDGEQVETAVVNNFFTTAAHAKISRTIFYMLDAKTRRLEQHVANNVTKLLAV